MRISFWLLVGWVCPLSSEPGRARVTSSDQTAATGLLHPYHPGIPLGADPGAAFDDWDNDEDPDLYVGRHARRDRLCRKDGSGNSTDVTSSRTPLWKTTPTEQP